jgi:peptide/nickel transport system substrate-binding protein
MIGRHQNIGSLAVWALLASSVPAFAGGELHFVLRSDPKTFDPLQVADGPSEVIRYLTGGVLIRVDRQTGKPVAELAESWRMAEGGRAVIFKLRPSLKFSDGTPFSADDVVFTIRRLGDPQLHSPIADSFRLGGALPVAEAQGANQVTVRFASPPAGVDRLFDQLPIQSSNSGNKELAVMGAFMLDQRQAGVFVRLRRNPQYWKRDSQGHPLPYLDAIRIDIQQNRDIELRRFEQGELSLMNSLDADSFLQLREHRPETVRDAGASLESEFLWFNQSLKSPLPEYKKAWFRSQQFRRAVSSAIERRDMVRLVYKGFADPAAGPVSAADPVWFNSSLKPQGYDPGASLERLKQDGFRLQAGKLVDRYGNAVEFSLVTNAGNKARARLAPLIEQDLAKVGIRLHIVTLDFPSLVERISRTLDYESALLSFTNVDGDPNGQMNVWLSSGEQHAWNPGQAAPETPWEAEIDRLMRAQAATADFRKRKASFDRVQAIVAEQAPLIYLVHPRVLGAVSRQVHNAAPAALWPNLLWNADRLDLAGEIARAK